MARALFLASDQSTQNPDQTDGSTSLDRVDRPRPALEAAFLNKARPDRRDPRLTFAQRVRAGVYRVVAQYEIVFVRSGGSENELRIGLRLEFDPVVRRLEGRQVACVKFVRNRDDPYAQGDPKDSVPRGRFVPSDCLPSGARRGN